MTISLSNAHLVTIAVGNLGGHERSVDTEDIAVHVNELAPGRFNWRKYSKYIDLEVVYKSLWNAQRESNGALLVGNRSKGWMLSPAGIKWLSSLDINEADGAQLAGYRRGSLRMSQELEAVRLRNTGAFKSYLEDKGSEITLNDFYKFARINEYFPRTTRQRRFAFIEGVVNGNAELQEFWTILKAKFPEEFE